ncbi:hypothetical protein JW935_25955 [candidate division KSB1 bacterium]|nr:hypothetical protein [candidate division KSB1 bacterium]
MACSNPFATREPEEPKSNQSTWIQPTSPTFLMANLRNAIKEKNAINYLRCLADTSESQLTFRYDADPAVANAHPGLFDRWGIEQEQTYFNQLLFFLPADSTSSLSLELLRENVFQDSVILLQRYQLTIRHKCRALDCPRMMEGQAEIKLLKNTSEFWYIYKWSDFSIGELPTWSELRAYFGK